MFDSAYTFKLLQKIKVESEPFKVQYRFTFSCKRGQRYVALAEEFEYNFFAIKFYLRSHEHSSKKYHMLTGFSDAPAVINTVLEIMKYILTEINEKASFGFTGASLSSEQQGVPTKRFRVYRRIMENLFSPTHFMHYALPASSAYFLINKKEPNAQELLNSITEMLKSFYEF